MPHPECIEIGGYLFPNPLLMPSEADILCYGATPETALLAEVYEYGVFPWFAEGTMPLWWCPKERAVIPSGEVRVSKSMRKILDREVFTFSVNEALPEVLQACAEAPGRKAEGAWLTDSLQSALLGLRREGKILSVEAWQDGILAGGFYGIPSSSVFCGESMFSRVSNASKAALIWFCRRYGARFSLIDCQVLSPHLESLGAVVMDREDFLQRMPGYGKMI